MRSFPLQAFLALAAVALWSTNAWAAGVALDAMSVGWLLLVQYGIATTAFLAVRLLRRGEPITAGGALTGPAIGIGVVGLTGTIFLQYVAFATAPIVAANVLAYAWPLIAAVWVVLAIRSRRAVVVVGLAMIGFGGVGLIFTSSGAADTGSTATATWGYAAALGSAACMAVYTVATSRIHLAATDLLLPAAVVGVLAAAVLTASTSSPWPQPVGWVAAGYIGLGPMAGGYGLWTLAMSDGGAERLAPLGYVAPLLSTMLLLATGSPATATTLVGIFLVLVCSIGVLATQRGNSSTGDRRHEQPRARGQTSRTP